MTWIKGKKDLAGTTRTTALYQTLCARALHVQTYYLPILGGLSPCSLFATASATYVTAANSLITPATCQWRIVFLAKVSGGTGTIKATVNSVAIEQTLTNTGISTTPLGFFTGTGDPEKVEIEAKCSGGNTLTIYSAVFLPRESYVTGINTAYYAPLVDALDSATGAPISNNMIRRLQANTVELMKTRPAALAYHADAETRAGISAGGVIRISDAFAITLWDYIPSFRVTILGPTATTATLRSNGELQTASCSDAAVEVSSATVSGWNLSLELDGPIESFVVYEV